ncbi:unnamed protein product [Toxocara canis]|uniref:WD_REPEATS_REGION domain-containing protein n=1 Tax=Toxocara canis TaxID=6265 RepID=A0A183UT26_TOXCA|nr:unnamed protein product [Toxocara canis]
MQALEGRCSTRSNIAKEYANHISEFTTTLKCFLIDQLHKKLEELNEPDRLLISRLNRALCELGDQQSTVLSRPLYHLPSPTRPAHRVWTMCTKDPAGLEKLISEVCEMANIPYKEKEVEEKPCDVRFSTLPPSLWNVDTCALLLLEQSEVDETAIARQRSSRPFNSMCSINGFPLSKSASSTATSRLSTPSLPSPTVSAVNNPATEPETNSLCELSPRKSMLSNGNLPPNSVRTQPPVEANVHVVRRSSFRERSLPSESESNVILKEDNLNVSNPHSIASSTCPSVASSIAPYPPDTSFDSQDSRPLSERTLSSCGPSSSSTTTVGVTEQNTEEFYRRFGENFLTRPIDVIALPVVEGQQQRLAISDSCGASSLAVDQSSARLLVSVMHAKGRSIHSFDIDSEFSKVEVNVVSHLAIIKLSKGTFLRQSVLGAVSIDDAFDWIIISFEKNDSVEFIQVLQIIPCPKEPKIELSRTRWITVSPRGEVFIVSGDNNRSAIWMYNRSRKRSLINAIDLGSTIVLKSTVEQYHFEKGRLMFKGWKTLKDSRKTRYQYLCIAEDQAEYRAVVLLTCDAAQNRLLLFVVDQSGTLINEYDLTKTYRLNDHIGNPASALVDENGNLLVLDYASGRLWVLLSGVKGVRRLKEIIFPCPLGAQQALGLAVCNDWVYVTCFNRREVVSVRYLCDRVFFPAFSSGSRTAQTQAQRRAISLPRPTGSSTRI